MTIPGSFVILMGMGILIRLLINALAVLITAYILQSGVRVNSFVDAVVVAVVLGIINAFIKPIVTILTLPINLLTLGIFSFILNGLFVLLVSRIVPGFEVAGFWWAVLFSVVLSLVSALLGMFGK